MSEWFAIPMLFAGGLFAGGVTSIALERVPLGGRLSFPNSSLDSRTPCDGSTEFNRCCWWCASSRRSASPSAPKAQHEPRRCLPRPAS